MRKFRLSLVLVVATFAMLFAAATPAWAEDVTGVTYLDANGDGQTCAAATAVTSDDTQWGSGGVSWYVVNSDVTINNRITVNGDVHLILADGATLNAEKGVRVEGDNELAIYAQSEGVEMGKLVAVGETGNFVAYAAIGSDNKSANPCGSITINGGYVDASVINCAAAIGTGYSAVSGGSVTINGGKVNAYLTSTGSGNPAAIGGGGFSSVDLIQISGGEVSASGDQKGIGNGTRQISGTVVIKGGKVAANGIGAGSYYYPASMDTRIEGGFVFLTGGSINGNDKSNCVVFENQTGQVYGNAILADDLEIQSGYVLTVGAGASLTIKEGVTLTNRGAITVNGGTFTNNGTIRNHGTIPDGVAGNGSILANKSSLAVAIKKDDDTAVSEADPASYGSSVTFIATVTANEALSGKFDSGMVEFSVDGGGSLGRGNVSWDKEKKTGAAMLTITNTAWSKLKVEKNDIRADFSGNSAVLDSAAGAYLYVSKAGQTAPVLTLAKAADDSISVSASNAGHGGLQYICVEGAGVVAPAVEWKDESALTGLVAGKAYTVFARFAGNECYKPSDSSAGLTVYTAAAKPESKEVSFVYETETVSFGDALEANSEMDFGGNKIESGDSISGYIGKTIYVRVKAVEGGAPASDPLEIKLSPRPPAPNVSINYEGETLSTSADMEYQVDGGEWKPCTDDMHAAAFDWDGSSEVTVGFRTRATDSAFASAEAVVTIPARPTAPAVAIDYENEALGASEDMEYRKANESSWSACGGAMKLSDLGWGGSEELKVSVRKKATATDFASQAADVTIPARPTAPTVASDYVTETLSTVATMEYSAGSGGWKPCAGNMAANDFGWDGTAEVKVKFRTAATDSTFASAETEVAIPARPEAPSTLIDYEGETLGTDEGMEYRKAGADTWEVCGSAMKLSDAGWDGSEELEVSVREKATAADFASQAAVVKIPARPVAVAPEVKSSVGTSIMVKAMDGQEYWIDGSDKVGVLSDDGTTVTFAGLEVGKAYKVCTRVKATEKSFASDQVSAEVTTSYPYVPTPPSTTETTTVTNPDGSTTTTVTDKETGTVTVTTKAKNGVVTETVKAKDAKPKVKVTLPQGVASARATIPVDATSATVVEDAGTGKVNNRCVPTKGGLAVLVTRSCELVVRDNAKDFSDMSGHWAQKAVDFASARGLMNGIGGTGDFEPDTYTSRAMVCAVLSNLEYGPEATKALTFSDTDADGWYAKAVAWAAEVGIVHGYGDGSTFGPSDDVTREQMACMIYNYAKAMGMDTTKRADLSDYADASDLTYGREAMEWCVASGIFRGYDGSDELGATDGLTRSQCAAVLMNLVTLIVLG